MPKPPGAPYQPPLVVGRPTGTHRRCAPRAHVRRSGDEPDPSMTRVDRQVRGDGLRGVAQHRLGGVVTDGQVRHHVAVRPGIRGALGKLLPHRPKRAPGTGELAAEQARRPCHRTSRRASVRRRTAVSRQRSAPPGPAHRSAAGAGTGRGRSCARACTPPGGSVERCPERAHRPLGLGYRHDERSLCRFHGFLAVVGEDAAFHAIDGDLTAVRKNPLWFGVANGTDADDRLGVVAGHHVDDRVALLLT